MREQSALHGKGLNKTEPYEAIVVDENDPGKFGQIRARVAGLMDDIPDDQLPWARPRGWNHPFGQMAKKMGAIGKTSFFGGVPRRGNKVELYFPTGDPHVATWAAATPIDKLSKDPVYDVNYPNRLGFRFPNGFQVLVDTQTNEVFFINPGDYNFVTFGDMNQTIVGNQQLIVTGDKGEVPAYILNDPNMSAKYLKSDPQGRIPFKGLLGRQVGSQHTTIGGHQTVHVKGNRKDKIDGKYDIEVGGDFKVDAKGEAFVNGSNVNLN
jgi:hypothetical protein